MTDEELEKALEPLTPEQLALPEAQIVVGDFVRFNTTVDIQPTGRFGGARFDRIKDEFNINSAMLITQVGQQLGVPYGVTRRDGRPSGVWPLIMLVKVVAPIERPAPPMVPDALP